MRKPVICICENKDADQRLCFRYTDSTIPLLPKYEISLAIFCDCTARFVSDLIGNPEDWFSHNKAQLKPDIGKYELLYEKNLIFAYMIHENKDADQLSGNREND